MSRVLTASIRDLCAADHHDDPATVSRWTANKSEDGVRSMLRNPEATLLVGDRDGEVAAVGCVTTSGEIGLNYVAPRHRFRGASKALLAAMEAELRNRGVIHGHLLSTATAHRFYLDAGWRDTAAPQDHGGVICYPMSKALGQD